jgi:hypothetical protein
MTSTALGLKILLHPAVVNTTLGNDLIWLDQFADRYSRMDDAHSLTGSWIMRTEATQLLYVLAWNYRRLQMLTTLPLTTLRDSTAAMIVATRRDLAQSLAVVEHDRAFRTHILTPRVYADLNNARVSPLTVKADFFDQELVQLLRPCMAEGRATVAEFGACVRHATPQSPSDAVMDLWLSGDPARGHPWSAAQEQPFGLDPQLRFLQIGPGTAPIRFLYRLTFDSRPFRDSTSTQGSVVDRTPWEYPEIATLVQQTVEERIAMNKCAKAVAQDVQRFIVLQRLFRTAIDGGLGARFPADRLVQLAHATKSAVVHVPTPTWLSDVKPPSCPSN